MEAKSGKQPGHQTGLFLKLLPNIFDLCLPLQDAARDFVSFVNKGPSPYHGNIQALHYIRPIVGLLIIEHLQLVSKTYAMSV